MTSNSTCPAIIYIREFVEHIKPDPTCPGKGLLIKLRISLNIPLKDIQSDDIEQNKILILLRFFNKGNQSNLYKLNTFIYSSGSFLTTSSDNNELYIIIHAYTLDRWVYLICYRTKLTRSSYPGNEEDTEIYFIHCDYNSYTYSPHHTCTSIQGFTGKARCKLQQLYILLYHTV